MRRIALLLCSPLLFSALLVPASSAERTPGRVLDPMGIVSSGPLGERSRDVRRYWTKERMSEARPLDRSLAEPADRATETASVGEPLVVEPSAPATERARGAGGILAEEIDDPSAVPYRTHGKVFFTSKGSDYVCSGTVVTSEYESLVVTAGHCLYEGNFASNFMFHPGFKSGTSPFGKWTAVELFTTTGWKNGWDNDDFTYDVGMAVMDQTAGETLQDAVGSRGIQFNQEPEGLEFEAYGYPAAAPFSGGRMYRCTSELDHRDSGSPAPLAIPCDMTGGSSGGGWVIDGQYVNSVVSYGYVGVDYLYGPYFGDAIATLYEAAGGTEPGPGPDPEERVDHEIGLTLTMRGHLRATGRMKVPDGYLPCRRGAPIKIFRTTGPTSVVFVKKTRTGDDGRFSIALPDRAGRYYAFGPEGEVNDLNNCLDAFSAYARHNH